MAPKFVTWCKIDSYTCEIVCQSSLGTEYQFGFATTEFEESMVRLSDVGKEALYKRIADFLETIWPEVKKRKGRVTCSFSNNHNMVVDGRYRVGYKEYIPYILSRGRAGKARMVRQKFIGDAFKKYLKNWHLEKARLVGSTDNMRRQYYEYDLKRVNE